MQRVTSRWALARWLCLLSAAVTGGLARGGVIEQVDLCRYKGRSTLSPAGTFGVEATVVAPSGRTVTLTTPGGEVADLVAIPGGYLLTMPNLPNWDIAPTGDYVVRVYTDTGKTNLEETATVHVGPLGDPGLFPTLVTPVPLTAPAYTVTAPSTGTYYRWDPYAAPAPSNSASHARVQVVTQDLAVVREQTVPVDMVTEFKPDPDLPAGTYLLVLGFRSAAGSSLAGGGNAVWANEWRTTYALTVTSGNSDTLYDTYEEVLTALQQDSGAWQNLPADATTPRISPAENTVSTTPALVTDGTLVYCAWSQTIDTGRREVYLRYFDQAHPELGWRELAGSGSAGGISNTADRDSVAPRLLVQPAKGQNPRRLWVVWQEGQMNDVLETLAGALKGVSLPSSPTGYLDFLRALWPEIQAAVTAAQNSPTHIFARYYPYAADGSGPAASGSWQGKDGSDDWAGHGLSKNDANSWASRPDVGLTQAGDPVVAWDYLRVYSNKSPAAKVQDIYNNALTSLGRVYGASNRESGAGWQALGGTALNYELGAVGGGDLSQQGKWDVSVMPRLSVSPGNGQPVAAWLHTEIEDATNSYRGFPQVHLLVYSGAGNTWSAQGDSDGPGGLSQLTGSACSQVALGPAGGSRLGVLYTRSGPEFSSLTGLPVTEVTGKVWDSAWKDYADDSHTGWRDLSQSTYDFASGPDITTGPDGNPVVTWVDVGLNVFALKWQWDEAGTNGQWHTLGRSWWMPSDINQTLALQAGAEVALGRDGNPIVAWNSAPIPAELEDLTTTLTSLSATASSMTKEEWQAMLDEVKNALATAIPDVLVRGYSPTASAAHVKSVAMEQGRAYEGAATEPHHELEIEVTTDPAVVLIEFTSPLGNTFTIPPNLYLKQGEIETRRWFDPNEPGAFKCKWVYEVESAAEASLAPYGDGDYAFRFFLADDTEVTATIPFSRPLLGSAIVQPSQVPAIIAPAHGSSVPSPVQVSWQPRTDAVVTVVEIEVQQTETLERPADEQLGPDATGYGPLVLTEGLYEVELCFSNRYSSTTPAGIEVRAGKFTERSHAFTVTGAAFTVSGEVMYGGRQAGTVLVQAWSDSAFSGVLSGSITIGGPGTYAIPNLRAGTYYLRAFRDSNGNGLADPPEAYGVYQTGRGNTPSALSIAGDVQDIDITMLDPDTDTDSLPDWWEMLYFANLGQDPADDPDHDAQTNLVEYLADTDPTALATLRLAPGWNLVSLPWQLTETVGDVFGVTHAEGLKSGSIYRWTAGQGPYVPVADDAVPEAEVGYWLYSDTGGSTHSVFGPLGDGLVDLASGWNLLGVVAACQQPTDARLVRPFWRWDAAAKRYEPLGDGEPLTPCVGYWIHALETISGFALSVSPWSADASEWSPEELELVEMSAEAEQAASIVASDEELLVTAEQEDSRGSPGGASRGGGPLAAFRTITAKTDPRRVEVVYDSARVKGTLVVTREGSVGNRFFRVDFVDGFTFYGIGISGQIELQRRDGFGAFDLRSRRDGQRLFTLRRTRGERRLKALLFVAAAIVVHSDRVEMQIPRNSNNPSGLAGDPNWTDADVQLRDRFLELFTATETLVLPTDFDTGICPKGGSVYAAGPFAAVPLTFIDRVNDISSYVGTIESLQTLIDAFKGFQFGFQRDLTAEVQYRFTSSSTAPALSLTKVPSVKVPVKTDNTGCALASGKALMSRVADILATQAINDTKKGWLAGKVEKHLLELADDKGCIPLPQGDIADKLKARIAAAVDWSGCQTSRTADLGNKEVRLER